MLTRWDEWYSRENLSADERILATPASTSAELAAVEFRLRGKQRILDIACGVGRDTFCLEAAGLSVIGTDVSMNGLLAATQKRLKLDATVEFINADARYLPFYHYCFDGIYCFGLLHEFTHQEKDEDVRRVISEAGRLLRREGILILTVAAGEPEAGLPQVQLFSRQMFEQATAGWHALEIKHLDDVGCTNRTDYHIWYGVFEK